MLGIKKLLIMVSMLGSFFMLAACGSDDAETAAAPAAAPAAESSAPAAEASAAPESGAGETLTIDQIEKAEGVVYQDEIYANWPYTEQSE